MHERKRHARGRTVHPTPVVELSPIEGSPKSDNRFSPIAGLADKPEVIVIGSNGIAMNGISGDVEVVKVEGDTAPAVWSRIRDVEAVKVESQPHSMFRRLSHNDHWHHRKKADKKATQFDKMVDNEGDHAMHHLSVSQHLLDKRTDLISMSAENPQKAVNFQCFLIGTVGTIGSVVESQLLYANHDVPTDIIFGLKLVVSVSTVILLGMIYKKALVEVALQNREEDATIKQIRGEKTLWTSSVFEQMLMEMVVICIHAPPGLHFTVPVESLLQSSDSSIPRLNYTFDSLCSGWMLIGRLYLILLVLIDRMSFKSERSTHIAKKRMVSMDWAFSIKATLELQPYKMLFFSLLVCVAVFAYLVQVFERPLCPFWLQDEFADDFGDCAVDPKRHDVYLNSAWMVWTTMTTVGYGDLYPVSFGGRVTVVLASMFGISIASILVSVFTSTLQFKVSQRNAFHDLMALKRHERLHSSAAALIYYSWRYAMWKKAVRLETSAARNEAKVLRRYGTGMVVGSVKGVRDTISDKRYFTLFEKSRGEFKAARREDAMKHDTQAMESVMKTQFVIQEKLRRVVTHNMEHDSRLQHVDEKIEAIHSKLDRLLAVMEAPAR